MAVAAADSMADTIDPTSGEVAAAGTEAAVAVVGATTGADGGDRE